MADVDVLIVGAGPTGLMMALQLVRRGVRFRIVSPARGPAEQSRATAVHARTLEFYRQLGFGDEVVAAGIPLDGFEFRADDKRIAGLQFGPSLTGLTPYPFALSYPQDDHEKLLGVEARRVGRAH